MAAEPNKENPPSEVLKDGDVVRAAVHRRIQLHTCLPDDQKFMARYPALWSWATFTDLSEEKVKERPNFSFRVSEGQWVLQISDPSMAASLLVQAQTFDGALKLLDSALGRADASWSPWRGKEAKLKARKPSK